MNSKSKKEIPVVVRVKGRELTIPTTSEITAAGWRYDVIIQIDKTKEKSKAPNIFGNVARGVLGIVDLGPAGRGTRFFAIDVHSGSGDGNFGHTQVRDAVLEALRRERVHVLAFCDANRALGYDLEIGRYTTKEAKKLINDLVGKSNSACRKIFIVEAASAVALLESIITESVNALKDSTSVAEKRHALPQPRTGVLRSNARPKPSVKSIVGEFMSDATRIGTDNEAEIEKLVVAFVNNVVRVPQIRAKFSVLR